MTELEDLKPVVSAILADINSPKKAVVLALSGDLGAGKTTFTQELARQLGVTAVVTSPTFVIMKSYDTTNVAFQQLIHIDAYRIEEIDEMRVLGFEQILTQKATIICIEWAERISSLLPAETINLAFTMSGEARIITQHA